MYVHHIELFLKIIKAGMKITEFIFLYSLHKFKIITGAHTSIDSQSHLVHNKGSRVFDPRIYANPTLNSATENLLDIVLVNTVLQNACLKTADGEHNISGT